VVARYGERFHRLWSFYLSYCEAGFSEGYLGVAQAAFEKAAWRKS
jgi:cyclopropane-fatty-acyl-phospholipid synthase